MLRIHASYHKCLTTYFLKTAQATYNGMGPSRLRGRKRYEHFESIEGVFYNTAKRYDLCSVNGFSIDLDRLGDDFRITRFVRDPRDLVVSGYFYHKRGAEPWFRMKNPTPAYWSAINAQVPREMPPQLSYAEYLSSLSLEDGLRAEIEFRRGHLESMRNWAEDPRIRVIRYEDLLPDQAAGFRLIADHLEITGLRRRKLLYFANRYAIGGKKAAKGHVRDPRPEQWREHFSAPLQEEFLAAYGDVLDRYGYATS